MTQSVYSEVYSILNMLGDGYINRLPKKLVDLIISEKLSSYNPIYSLDIAIEEQNISEDALAMITLFNLKYWCEPAEKEKILKVLEENEKQYKVKNEQRTFNDTEENRVEKVSLKNEKKEVSVVLKKENFFHKIVGVIKHIFNVR